MGNVLLINPSYQPSYGGAKYGLIRSFDWDEYFIYTTKPLFAHKTLSYEATVTEALATRYYAPERWPRCDFFKSRPSIATRQVVRQEKRRAERTALAS